MKYPPTDPDTAATLLAEGEALRGLARSLLSRDDPDDLLQDGYVAALARPDAPRQLGPWLTGTLRRLAARWRRRSARQTRREQLVARAEHDDASDPARIAAQAEATRLLGAAVHALDEPFRTVVVLRFWHGMMPATIARRLGVPVNTVRSRLQRALVRLREVLDERAGRRDAWAPALASLLPTTDPLLLAPTSATAAFAAIMTTKLLVGACLVLAALVALPFVWPAPPTPAAVVATPSAPAAPALAGGPEQLVTAPREAVEPRPLAPNSPTADETPGAAPVVAPWTMHVVVVDEHGKAVPEALVWIWSGKLRAGKPPPGSTGNLFTGRTDEVLAKLLTDADGSVTATLDREMVYLRADKDATQSGEHWHSHVHPTHELQLMLRPRIPVAGRVVGVDGMPAAGAKVTVAAKGVDTRTLSKAPAPPPLTTDDAGCFTCDLLADFAYEVQATHGEAKSFVADLHLARTPPPELVLTFPGAITLRGTVVDIEGQPIGGASIRIWRDEPQPASGDEERAYYLTANAEGQFSTPLRTHGRYSAMASPQGQARAVASAETSPERPHAEIRLVVPRFDTIRGQVHHSDGKPLANAKIHAEAGPVTSAATPEPSVRERHATGGEVALDADGRFTLRVQPETTWTLVVTPRGENRELWFRREGIRSGTSDLVLVASDAELAGCTIRGRVLAPGGEPLTTYEVTLVETVGADRWSKTPDARITAEGFEVPPIAIGKTVHVHVTPKDQNLTLRVFGPFVTSADGITIDARVELGAVLPVRVRESDGTPARAVLVNLNGDAPGERAYGPVPVGPDGCARLGGRVPGTRRLYLSREVTPIHEQEVVVLPGENPELVITLPPATTKPPR